MAIACSVTVGTAAARAWLPNASTNTPVINTTRAITAAMSER